MDTITTKVERCKECSLCVAHCPNEAISFSATFNTAGYRYAVVNDAACVKCGMCYIMCPDGVYTITGGKTAGRK